MIRISRGESKNLEGDYSLFISFKYNQAILDKVKSLPTRRYDADTRMWEIPEWDIKKAMDVLADYFQNDEVELDDDVDVEATRPLSEYEKKVAEGVNWVLFSEELEFIKDENTRNFAIDLLDRIPKYFYTVAASSTGKYHPQYALGEGGLVRHTRAAMKIANEILNNDTMCGNFTATEKDIVLLALLFHDSLKHGHEDEAGGYTIFSHPIKAVDWIEGMYQAGHTLEIDVNVLDGMLDCIATHMGQWNKPYGGSGEEELPLPKSKLQKITHLCDYLASRKFLEVIFLDK